jgi:hypothetical protein
MLTEADGLTSHDPTMNFHPITIGRSTYNIYDTPGIDPDAMESDPIAHLVPHLQGKVGLLVFCMCGRISEGIVSIYQVFSHLAPAVIVITGLEHEDSMESWWARNEVSFINYTMHFYDHACVTTIRGKQIQNGFTFDLEYKESQEAIRCLISRDYKVISFFSSFSLFLSPCKLTGTLRMPVCVPTPVHGPNPAPTRVP